jgi:hypothetical protein
MELPFEVMRTFMSYASLRADWVSQIIECSVKECLHLHAEINARIKKSRLENARAH